MFKPYLMIKRKAFMTYTNPNTATRINSHPFFHCNLHQVKDKVIWSQSLASEFKGQRAFKIQFRPDNAYKPKYASNSKRLA